MESARFKIKESGICTNACNAILSSISLIPQHYNLTLFISS